MGPKFMMLHSTIGMKRMTVVGPMGRAITYTGTMGTISAGRPNASATKLTRWASTSSDAIYLG